MKTWYAFTCCICGFRHPITRFTAKLQPIVFPVQLVTGGGRAKGFRVVKYLPWSSLPSFARTETWNSILCLYNRLGAAYDLFYETLGFMSPKMRMLLQSSYAVAYQPNPLDNYSAAYGAASMSQGIVESYTRDDISDAYSESLSSASNWRFES